MENICRYLVEGAQGNDVAVLCFNDERKDRVDEVNGVRVYRVATWVNVSKQALSLSYFPILRRALREFQPDVIHFHWANPYPAMVLLTMMPKRVKLVVHWHMDIIAQTKLYPFVKPIETALLRRADIVLVTSPNYRDHSLPLRPFKHKVRILFNAIDEEKMKLREGDQTQIDKLRERYGKKIVFFVGRHIEYKGLPHLIEAEKMVRSDCAFVVAGKGHLTDKLKAMCTSRRVHFVGRLSDDELRWHYHAAFVFAFPSVTKNEAFGLVLAEAMYCKTPAVTFTLAGSGVNWVCPNGECGIEVPNGNDEAFAEAIDRLLSDEALATAMGEAGHKRVKENFTISTLTNTMNEYYKTLVG